MRSRSKTSSFGAWTLYPEAFSLRGYFAKHPDSNRVLAKLSGVDGLCGLGWLEHTDQRMYRVTRKGRVVAKQLQGVLAGAGAVAAVNVADAVVETVAASVAPKAVRGAQGRGSPRAEGRAQGAQERGRRRSRPSLACRPRSTLSAQEVIAIGVIAKGDALRKFLRGSPLTFADACSFWGISPRTSGANEKVDAVEDLLKRVVDSLGTEGATDGRLPSLSTCYGLLNLHRLMLGRFARELDAVRAQRATG